MTSSNLKLKVKDFERKQIIVAVIALLVLCGLSIVLNNLHLTSLAEESTKYLTRHISSGNKREVTLLLNQAHLSNYKVIRYVSQLPDQSFTIPAKAELEDRSDIVDSLFNDRVSTEVSSGLFVSKGDKIVYEFSRFRFIPYAFIIWLFLLLMSVPPVITLKRRLINQFEKDVETERKVAKAEIAREVRHNLRTPLASLMGLPDTFGDSNKEAKELLTDTIKQIQSLVSKLDEDKPIALLKSEDTGIYDTLVSARQQIKGLIPPRIDFDFYIEDMISSDLVKHIPFELRAILSNIVVNSIEAIDGAGKIIVRAIEKPTHIMITISDDGKGIPQEVIGRIFDQNYSYDKQGGSGVGLYHAKKFITSWQGDIQVESFGTNGARFTIKLPIQDKTSWFLPSLKINSESNIFILDDQQSALTLWRQKFFGSSHLDRVSFFNKVDEFKKSSSNWKKNSVFLIDYDLGTDVQNGIELLKNTPKDSIRCLVTGHFDDVVVREKCKELNYFIIPKSNIQSLRME